MAAARSGPREWMLGKQRPQRGAAKKNKAMKKPAAMEIPKGWQMFTKVRRTGSTIDKVDKYYKRSADGKLARSLIEVHAMDS